MGVTLTLEQVRTRAITEEMRLQQSGSDHVLLTNGRQGNQNFRAGKRKVAFVKGAFVEKWKCFKCKKPGHLAKDCPEGNLEIAAVAIEEIEDTKELE